MPVTPHQPSRRHFMWITSTLCASLLSGCSPEINNRGYQIKKGAFDQIREGMSKQEVESALGSPSTTASAKLQGDSYYYVTSTTVGRSFLNPKEVNRQVIAIRFDQNDQVESFAQYGLEDGRIININDRTTPVPGADASILKELFGGSRVGPSIPGAR